MFIKICTNFFLFSGGYKFEIYYLKEKNETLNVDSLLAEQFQVIPVAARVLLLAQEVKIL